MTAPGTEDVETASVPGAASGREGFAGRVRRGLVWNQASRLVELASAYATSVIVARALGPIEFGTYSIALSLVTFAYYGTSLGLNEVLNVHVPRLAGTPARVAHLFRAVLRRRAGIALAVAVGLFLGAPLVARAWRDPALGPVVQVAAIYALFYNVSLALEYFLVGSLQVPRASRARLLVQLLNLAAAFAALRWHWHARLLIALMAGSAALGVAWLAWGTRGVLAAARERFDVAPLMRFGRTLWVTNFVNFFLGRQSDIMVIGLFRPGSGEAGAYSAATLLAALLSSGLLMGAEGVSLAAFSDLEQRVDRAGIGRLWSLHVKMDVLLSVPLLVYGVVFARELVALLYTSGFASAVPLVTAFCVVWIVTRVLGGGTNMTVLYAMGEPRLPLLIYGATGVFNLVANLFLVHAYGARGAVVGTGLAMLASGLASGLLIRRRTGAWFPFGFAAKVLLVSSLGGWAAAMVPRPGGLAGLLVAAVVGLVVSLVGLRLLRPLHDDDRRLLVRLTPRFAWLVERL